MQYSRLGVRPRRIVTTIALLVTALTGSVHAQPWTGPIVPSPEPFSLSARDATHAIALIRRVGLLQWWDGESRPRTVAVRQVYARQVGYNPDAYERHRERFDLVLNNEPLDWDHLYIAYDEDVLNLRLLYTYRNQQPVPDVPYRLRWAGQTESR
jgi:hypothetical protein